jgi:hypothetical protein
MQPEDMYVLNPDGSHLEVPPQKPYPAKKVKCSDCHPLFLEVGTLKCLFLQVVAYVHFWYIEACAIFT